MSLFRNEFSGRGELAERQQKLSKVFKYIVGHGLFPISFTSNKSFQYKISYVAPFVLP